VYNLHLSEHLTKVTLNELDFQCVSKRGGLTQT